MSTFYDESEDMEFWETMGDAPAEAETAEPVVEQPQDEIVAQVETPAEEADTAEVEEAPERERDERGRFVAKEQPAEERLFAGKYRTAEEMEAAYSALESRFGQQGSDLGELRRELQAIREELQPQQPQQQQYDMDQVSSWFDENPTQIPSVAVQAYDQGNQQLYNAAIDAWYEYSPREAARFERSLEMQQLRQEFQQHTAPVQEQVSNQAFAQAYREVSAKYEDFDQFAPAMGELAQARPAILKALQEESPEARAQVLEDLYLLARARQSDTLVPAAREAAKAAAEAALQAKEDAVTVSATSTIPEQPKKSAADLIGEQWDALDDPYKSGWNV